MRRRILLRSRCRRLLLIRWGRSVLRPRLRPSRRRRFKRRMVPRCRSGTLNPGHDGRPVESDRGWRWAPTLLRPYNFHRSWSLSFQNQRHRGLRDLRSPLGRHRSGLHSLRRASEICTFGFLLFLRLHLCRFLYARLYRLCERIRTNLDVSAGAKIYLWMLKRDDEIWILFGSSFIAMDERLQMSDKVIFPSLWIKGVSHVVLLVIKELVCVAQFFDYY